jgi:hypothetical protein
MMQLLWFSPLLLVCFYIRIWRRLLFAGSTEALECGSLSFCPPLFYFVLESGQCRCVDQTFHGYVETRRADARGTRAVTRTLRCIYVCLHSLFSFSTVAQRHCARTNINLFPPIRAGCASSRCSCCCCVFLRPQLPYFAAPPFHLSLLLRS